MGLKEVWGCFLRNVARCGEVGRRAMSCWSWRGGEMVTHIIVRVIRGFLKPTMMDATNKIRRQVDAVDYYYPDDDDLTHNTP